MLTIHSYLTTNLTDTYVQKVVEQATANQEHGFFGYKTRQAAKNSLEGLVYGQTPTTLHAVNEKEVKSIITSAYQRVADVLPGDFSVYLFPTVGRFVKEHLRGVSGFSVYKNSVVLGVSQSDSLTQAITDTLIHELAHAYRARFVTRNTVADDVIDEGLAEHFKESFATPTPSPMIQQLSSHQPEKLYEQLKDHMYSTDNAIRDALMFGSKQFPQWSVYTIGYWLIQQQELSWPDALTQPTSYFLE